MSEQQSNQVDDVVVTKDMHGRIVAVTRQDEEGRILSIIAESDEIQLCAGSAPAEVQPDLTSHYTVVFRGLTAEERRSLNAHPKAVVMSHSHAVYERDAALRQALSKAK